MAGPDFAELRRTIPLDRVLEYLGIEAKWARKQMRGKCPICKSKIPRVFAATPSIGLFRCFACHASGDCIELVARVREISKYEAAKELQRTFNPP